MLHKEHQQLTVYFQYPYRHVKVLRKTNQKRVYLKVSYYKFKFKMASTYYLKNKSLLSAENLINPPVIPKTDKHAKENYKSIKSIQKSNKAFAKSKEEAKASKKPPFKLDQYKHVESLVFASKPKADIGPFKNPPAL